MYVTASLTVPCLLVVAVPCRSAASGYTCSKDEWTRNNLSVSPACRVRRIHLGTLKKFLTVNWRPLLEVVLIRKVLCKFSIFHFAVRLYVFCRHRHTTVWRPNLSRFVTHTHTHTHTQTHSHTHTQTHSHIYLPF